MNKLIVLLVLAQIFLSGATELCNEACDGEFCVTKCHGTVDDSLCKCDESADSLRWYTAIFNVFSLQNVKAGSKWSCKGAGCGGLETTPPTLGKEEDCKQLCKDNADCRAYIWSPKPTTPYFTCELIKDCKSLEESDDIVECSKCLSAKKCSLCPMAKLEHSPTSIHWSCDAREGNIYQSELPDGTKCHPTNVCADPAVTLTDEITCNAQGKWESKDGELDETTLDKSCNCPELKVAYSAGSELICASQDGLEPQEDGSYLLKQSNTCNLFCDAYLVSELSCTFGKTGTIWQSYGSDGSITPLSGCISCDYNACQQDATTEKTTEETTETP